MNRKDLVDKLEQVAPALSGNDLIPILTHFWFTGEHVLAYNDQIAISAPCKVDFEGAVPGMTLLNLLKASRAKDVEFVVGKDDKNELTIKAASSRFKLGLLPYRDFEEVFVMPKPGKDPEALSTKSFLSCIDCCMRSVSIDTSVPDQLGITLIPDGKDLLFYSTDDRTLSHARLAVKGGTSLKQRVILSSHFCRQVLNLVNDAKPLHLEIHKDHALLMGAGGTLLFGKLVHSEKPLNFNSILDHNFPEGSENKLVTIPTKLELILERAVIVASASVEPVRTHINVQGGVVRFSTVSARGEVHDTLQIEGKHKDVEIKVDAKLLKNGYGQFDQMLLTSSCFVMVNEDVLYLVAASGS